MGFHHTINDFSYAVVIALCYFGTYYFADNTLKLDTACRYIGWSFFILMFLNGLNYYKIYEPYKEYLLRKYKTKYITEIESKV